MRDTIATAAGSYRSDLIDFVREIVSIRSLSGEEGPVVDRLKAEMLEIGYDEVRIDPMGNLLGRIGSGGKIIALDGHCDTVDIGDPTSWDVDPFGAELGDGVIYGRGAVDQKGGLAAAIYAGKILKEIGMPDNVSLLVVASVSEEEVEGLNWQYIIKEDGIVPDAVLLTEPTGLSISIGQRGRTEIRVRTDGVSCHGSAPEHGENAVYKMAPIILEVEQLHKRLRGDPVLGNGSVTVTDVRSTSPSHLYAVPDSATIHLDRRLTVGETLESAIQEVEELPAVRAADADVFMPEYEVTTHTGLVHPAKPYYPPWLMSESDPLVRTASEAYRGQFEEEPRLSTWGFSTNGVTTKGVYDIPTIGFGPGAEEHAHTSSDQVRVEDLVKATAFYAAFVLGMN
ncbi:MAG: YgeY family selenium metabolism-linked hydrolase [Gemmatimonadota bacterium]|nr:MAG: YgeY family selenium metabolism-linked hydrolase [Gemmatimonadota bacterium]